MPPVGQSLFFVEASQLGIAVFFLTLDAGLLARIQYSDGPVTGILDTGFSWFPCVYKQMVPKIPSCHYMLLM